MMMTERTQSTVDLFCPRPYRTNCLAHSSPLSTYPDGLRPFCVVDTLTHTRACATFCSHFLVFGVRHAFCTLPSFLARAPCTVCTASADASNVLLTELALDKNRR